MTGRPNISRALGSVKLLGVESVRYSKKCEDHWLNKNKTVRKRTACKSISFLWLVNALMFRSSISGLGDRTAYDAYKSESLRSIKGEKESSVAGHSGGG